MIFFFLPPVSKVSLGKVWEAGGARFSISITEMEKESPAQPTPNVPLNCNNEIPRVAAASTPRWGQAMLNEESFRDRQSTSTNLWTKRVKDDDVVVVFYC